MPFASFWRLLGVSRGAPAAPRLAPDRPGGAPDAPGPIWDGFWLRFGLISGLFWQRLFVCRLCVLRLFVLKPPSSRDFSCLAWLKRSPVRACVRACVHARVPACVRSCARAWACVRACARACVYVRVRACVCSLARLLARSYLRLELQKKTLSSSSAQT